MIIQKIRGRWKWVHSRLHDYLYLQSELRFNKDKVDTVYAGSSYVIFGVNTKSNTINLGLPSQDIYYSAIAVKKALENNKSIKKVVLGVGYYSLYCDLSQSKSPYEMERILDVYYPIFRDIHNMDVIEFKKLKKSDDLITKVFFLLQKKIYKKSSKVSYFSDPDYTREVRKLALCKERKIRWLDLDSSEKNVAARIRTASHEKQFKYKESFSQNINILRKLVEYCKDRKIDFYVFVAPMSESYLNNISEIYKTMQEHFQNEIDSIPLCGYVDCNHCEMEFNDECFVDPDHLSDIGAQKLTEYLLARFG